MFELFSTQSRFMLFFRLLMVFLTSNLLLVYSSDVLCPIQLLKKFKTNVGCVRYVKEFCFKMRI